jgi:hypothetical protein
MADIVEFIKINLLFMYVLDIPKLNLVSLPLKHTLIVRLRNNPISPFFKLITVFNK